MLKDENANLKTEIKTLNKIQRSQGKELDKSLKHTDVNSRV